MQTLGSQFSESADRSERARLAKRLIDLRLAAARANLVGWSVSFDEDDQAGKDAEYLQYLAGRLDPRD